jgi:hypothetical protein
MLQKIRQELLFNIFSAENTKVLFFLVLPIFEKVLLYLTVLKIRPLVHLMTA